MYESILSGVIVGIICGALVGIWLALLEIHKVLQISLRQLQGCGDRIADNMKTKTELTCHWVYAPELGHPLLAKKGTADEKKDSRNLLPSNRKPRP
jgi:hypothetical protein